jgi:hypothetical protein
MAKKKIYVIRNIITKKYYGNGGINNAFKFGKPIKVCPGDEIVEIKSDGEKIIIKQ